MKKVLAVLLALAIGVGLYFGIKALVKKNDDPSNESGTTPVTDTASVTGNTETQPSDPTAQPTDSETPETTAEIDPALEAVRTRDAYTDAEITGDDSRWNQIVATCGDYQLNNRLNQVFYYMQYLNFMNQYGSYAAMFGLDSSKPLSEQPSMTQGLTWEQHFLKSGIDGFHQYASAAAKAAAEGHELSEEEKTQIESIITQLPEDAKTYGFDSVDAYIQESFGPGVSQTDYESFLRLYFSAMSYDQSLYEAIKWTDEDLLAYYEAHTEEFGDATPDTPNVNVRHILIMPKTAEEGADPTDEEKNAAKTKAEELLAEFLKDPTEDHFAELAKENTEDPGSKENGGLYEDVYPGQMVETFNDWCFDAARKPGDTDIVETSYGYHVMYFVKTSENYHWREVAEQNYPMSIMNTKIAEMKEEYPITVEYENVVLAPLPQPEEEEQ